MHPRGHVEHRVLGREDGCEDPVELPCKVQFVRVTTERRLSAVICVVDDSAFVPLLETETPDEPKGAVSP